MEEKERTENEGTDSKSESDTLREVVTIMQERIDNPNARHYVIDDLKTCVEKVNEVIEQVDELIETNYSISEEFDFQKKQLVAKQSRITELENQINSKATEEQAKKIEFWIDHLNKQEKEFKELEEENKRLKETGDQNDLWDEAFRLYNADAAFSPECLELYSAEEFREWLKQSNFIILKSKPL